MWSERCGWPDWWGGIRWSLAGWVSMRSGTTFVRVVEGSTFVCKEAAAQGAIPQALL